MPSSANLNCPAYNRKGSLAEGQRCWTQVANWNLGSECNIPPPTPHTHTHKPPSYPPPPPPVHIPTLHFPQLLPTLPSTPSNLPFSPKYLLGNGIILFHHIIYCYHYQYCITINTQVPSGPKLLSPSSAIPMHVSLTKEAAKGDNKDLSSSPIHSSRCQKL